METMVMGSVLMRPLTMCCWWVCLALSNELGEHFLGVRDEVEKERKGVLVRVLSRVWCCGIGNN